jgi:hypothetical protein
MASNFDDPEYRRDRESSVMESEIEKLQRESNLIADIARLFPNVGIDRARQILDYLYREQAKLEAKQRAQGIEPSNTVPVMVYRDGDLTPRQLAAIKAGLRAEYEAKKKGTENE